MVKRAKGAGGHFLCATVFDVTKLPAFFAHSLGEVGVGPFYRAGAHVPVDGWKPISDGCRFDVDNHRIWSFLECGSMIRVEETGTEDCDVFGVEDRLRQLGQKVRIALRHEGNR